jgi:hypothetical protein
VKFEIVPAADRPEMPHSGATPSALSLALEAGETVFSVDANLGLRNKESYLSVRGFRLHQLKAERNGVKGFYLWADKA